MGVSGCGKTTIGTALANRLGWTLIESDNYHSSADIHKMSVSIPLTDADRFPWLENLNELLLAEQRTGNSIVLACSALKHSYRNLLYRDINCGMFVYLKGSYTLILARMQEREHFMKPEMLQSQFDALEEPRDALYIEIEQSVASIVDQIITSINH